MRAASSRSAGSMGRSSTVRPEEEERGVLVGAIWLVLAVLSRVGGHCGEVSEVFGQAALGAAG
jgi:hypothetical protein